MLKMYVEAKNRLHALKAYMQDSKGATAIGDVPISVEIRGAGVAG